MCHSDDLAARLAAAEALNNEALTRICGAFRITSVLQLAAIAERDEETTLDLIVKLIDRVQEKLAAAEARCVELERALRHAARELQYIADDDPCHQLHQTEEGLACIRLAETLLGPMLEWPDEPNATVSTGFRVWKIRAALAGGGE